MVYDSSVYFSKTSVFDTAAKARADSSARLSQATADDKINTDALLAAEQDLVAYMEGVQPLPAAPAVTA